MSESTWPTCPWSRSLQETSPSPVKPKIFGRASTCWSSASVPTGWISSETRRCVRSRAGSSIPPPVDSRGPHHARNQLGRGSHGDHCHLLCGGRAAHDRCNGLAPGSRGGRGNRDGGDLPVLF